MVVVAAVVVVVVAVAVLAVVAVVVAVERQRTIKYGSRQQQAEAMIAAVISSTKQ